MSTLKDQLRADLTTAMKARETVRSSTLRMVLTAVSNAEVAGKEQRELSDDEVLTVLTSEAKRRRQAATAYHEADREDLAEKEEAEAAVIADYLPEQLSESEVADLVASTIEKLGAKEDGMRAMGKVMGALQPQVKGKADGAVVAAEVKKQLA